MYVWPRHSQVQEGANHAPILLVHGLTILIDIKSRHGGHGRRKRLGLAPIKLLQDAVSILALMHNGPVLDLLDLQPKKEVQLGYHAHLKLPAHSI